MKSISKSESITHKRSDIDVVDFELLRIDQAKNDNNSTISHKFNIVFSCKSNIAEHTMHRIEGFLIKSYNVYEVSPDPMQLYKKIIAFCGAKTFRSISIKVEKKYDGCIWESYIYFEGKELQRIEFSEGTYNEDFTKWVLYKDGDWEFKRKNYSIEWDGYHIKYSFKAIPEFLYMVPSGIESNVTTTINLAKAYFKKYF